VIIRHASVGFMRFGLGLEVGDIDVAVAVAGDGDTTLHASHHRAGGVCAVRDWSGSGSPMRSSLRDS
jgi:hypothetical protein